MNKLVAGLTKLNDDRLQKLLKKGDLEIAWPATPDPQRPTRIYPNEKGAPKSPFFIWKFISPNFSNYFTLLTIALNAAGLFIARSARTLRLISIWALLSLPINCE